MSKFKVGDVVFWKQYPKIGVSKILKVYSNNGFEKSYVCRFNKFDGYLSDNDSHTIMESNLKLSHSHLIKQKLGIK